MNPQLTLLLGPTGIGKTGAAVKAAVRERCPVIALDRIQCHPELATGSGRPSTAELAGTRRIYLTSRLLAAGPLPADTAAGLLHALLQEQLESGAQSVIVEGGSTSALTALLERADWRTGWAVRVVMLLEASAARYEAGVARRVEHMLGYRPRNGGGGCGGTVQGELAAVWNDPLARKHAADITGYHEVLALCERHSLTPAELTGPSARLWRQELTAAVRDAHLAYGLQQRRVLADALPALTDIADGRVEWRLS